MASDTHRYWDSEDSDGEMHISMITDPRPSLVYSSFSQVSEQWEHAEIPTTALPSALPLDCNSFEPLRLAFGEVPEKVSTFVPFKLVKRYPHFYVGNANKRKVVDYFRETLLKDRVWDFFSQHDPTASKDPLLLISTSQFEEYLNTASHQLGVNLVIPRGGAGEQFSLTFGQRDTPRPRFLGRANNTSAIDALKARGHTLPADDLSHLSPACYQMYCDKMNEIYSSFKPGKSLKKEATKKKRIQRQKDSGRMLKRVQRYLGLRQAISHLSSHMSSKSLIATNWDVSKPAPFKARESVRFVCVDVEAYERDTRVITEIGLAVLNTEDLIDICPGEGGVNYFSLVQAHHVRIMERCNIVNHEFVVGCPEAFHFGKSQMVPIKDINRVVGKIIGDQESEDQRPVIIVGHDIKQDLKYLMGIGYNYWLVPQIVDEIDTKDMFQRVERSPNGRGLSTICNELGIFGRNYHNAGNDAVYTLQAMIAMAVKRTVEGSDRNEESFTPSSDEWTDGDMDDGGCPKKSTPLIEHINGS